MPVPLGRSGSEPQDAGGKHLLDRRPSQSHEGFTPKAGDIGESALGLENMHLDAQSRRGIKPPTVGCR